MDTCRSQGLLFGKFIGMDDAPLLRRALRAIGYENVRAGILPSRE